MSIISLAQLQKIMIDTSLSANSTTSDLAGEAITDAEAEVRAALAPRYDVTTSYFQTTTSAPPQLVQITRNIAAGHCYMHFGRGGKDAFVRAEKYLKLGRDALARLQKREEDLVDASGNVIAERSNAFEMYSNTDDYTETFGEDNPHNWAVDEDKLDDIRDDREA